MQSSTGTLRVIIIGGGFAGVACAQTLRRQLRGQNAEIVLFDKENHLVFQPLLAEVVGSSLDPSAIIAPLRQLLPGVSCRTEDVVKIDFEHRRVVFATREDRTGTLEYDHVVIACGGASNLSVVPGMANHAYPLRTMGDAVELRAHVLGQLEKAEVCQDEAERRLLLSFVIVGGGYSGVEVAGEIHDLIGSSRCFYRNIPRHEASVTIVHSGDELLPEISESLRAFAGKKMLKAGVKLCLKSRCARAEPDGVVLTDGRKLPAGTIVCTIGGTSAPLVNAMPASIAREKGRLVTEPDMRLKGQAHAWAVGDCALVTNAYDGKPASPTGQFAQRQGKQCAMNIVRSLRGEPTRPFSFRVLGQLCSIGGHSAVAEMMGMKISGFLAWFIWRGVYLMKLPSWSRRVKVGLDWAWDLVFPRDLGIVKADTTARHSVSVYEAGQFVFKEGDPASTFFVIQQGEVEVVKHRAGQDMVVAVLKEGDFFGEKALHEQRPRSSSVRARTRVEVLAIERDAINQMMKDIPALAGVLKDALLRRADEGWRNLPEITRVLEDASVGQVMRVFEPPLICRNQPARDALEAFADPDRSHCLVVCEAGQLAGFLTLDHLVKWLPQAKPGATVADMIDKEPVAVTLDDSAFVAAETAAAHGLRRLPIVRSATNREPVGIVDFRDLVRAGLGLPAQAPSAPVARAGVGVDLSAVAK